MQIQVSKGVKPFPSCFYLLVLLNFYQLDLIIGVAKQTDYMVLYVVIPNSPVTLPCLAISKKGRVE